MMNPNREPIPIICFLIDDDADDQEIFCLALQELDESIQCVFANNGEKAVEKLRDDQFFFPHYIFVDMNMPCMNGAECLEEIKKISRIKEVPVFMFSTSVDPYTLARTKALGAVNFIVKPSSISLLSKLLGEHLNINIRFPQ